MKKEYIYPEMQVVELKMSTLMAGSVGRINDNVADQGSKENPAGFAPGLESGSDDLDW